MKNIIQVVNEKKEERKKKATATTISIGEELGPHYPCSKETGFSKVGKKALVFDCPYWQRP